MYRTFPGATQPNCYQYSTADQQVDTSWNTHVTDEQQERRTSAQATGVLNNAPTASDEVSTEYLTSPPLASFSVLLKDDGEFRDSEDLGSRVPSEKDIYTTGLDTSMAKLAMQDAMELVSFKLGQQAIPRTTTRHEAAAPESIQSEKPAAPQLQTLDCPSFSSSDDDDMIPFSRIPTMNSFYSTRGERATAENDRGFRKKSREKMRRHEVNIKFEMLVNVLGLAGRTRKKNILHEAASAIKGLKRECNQLRRDRDRLQQELNYLATYLQSTESEPTYVAS